MTDPLSDADVAQLRLALGLRTTRRCPDCGEDISRLSWRYQRCVTCALARQRALDVARNVARSPGIRGE